MSKNYERFLEKNEYEIYCEDPYEGKLLEEILRREGLFINFIKEKEKLSKNKKIIVLGKVSQNFKAEDYKELQFIPSLKDLFLMKDEKNEEFYRIILGLGKLIDKIAGLPTENITKVFLLCEELGKEIGLKEKELMNLKIACALRNIGSYLIEKLEYSPFETKTISLQTNIGILKNWFGEPLFFFEKLFGKEEESIYFKIINAVENYIKVQDFNALRENTKNGLDPFIVESLIKVLQKGKIKKDNKIFIIDANKEAYLLKLRLENEGYITYLSKDPISALEKIFEVKPELIISEVLFPGFDGFQFLDKLNKELKKNPIPLIFVSEKKDDFTIKRAFALGAYDFLGKPIDFDIILTKICRVLNEKFVPRVEFLKEPNEKELNYYDIKVGSVINGRFKLENFLGEGGMGLVFSAYDIELNEKVVLKILKKDFLEDSTIIKKFKEELKIARKIIHPNVVRLYDFFEAGEILFFTQEYLDGSTLRNILNLKKILNINEGIFILKQVLKGLEAAHNLNIIHKDIKPENIFILKNNFTKILDFGIAQILESKISKYKTSVHGTVGTPEYMSPEQLSSRPVDHRTDIYSLGIVFYEMLTGEVPFQGKTAISTALLHLQKLPKPPTNINPKVPLKLEQIILKMLKKSPEERYSSTNEVLQNLEAL